MKRSELREHIFRMIFQVEFLEEAERKEQIGLYLDALKDASNRERTYMQSKTSRIFDMMDEIDDTISEISTGWKLNRLGKAELAILRLAVYEILHDEDIPNGVAINEAVELAKKYGSEQSPKFVNGVLAKLV
ncbi:MAG: transcription antitermination factor NusB [Lachnospiraceae bacterium]|nr:transcription antitermination factor NusB [Lachnospiraceae bacterium]